MGDLLNLASKALDTIGDLTGFTPAGAVLNLAGNVLDSIVSNAKAGENLEPVSTVSYYIPGVGGETKSVDENGLFQSSPLLNTYSPRLMGAPHQLTHLNDMRLMSSDGNGPGPVGDFYLEKILNNAEICNIVVGRAVFTGGMNGFISAIRNLIHYSSALKKYGNYIYANTPDSTNQVSGGSNVKLDSANLDTYKAALNDKDSASNKKNFNVTQEEDEFGNTYSVDADTETGEVESMMSSLESWFEGIDNGIGQLRTALKTSFSVQQPFYTFDSDWSSYIQRVKFMINAFTVMLGCGEASVRIDDKMWKIAAGGTYKPEEDVWANYRFITPKKDLGSVTAIDTTNGDTTQYVSFMIDPSGSSESYTNSVGDSQIYGIVNQGSTVGNEIAFLTNSSQSAIDDAIIGIASKSINAAEAVLSGLGGGIGRFTASIAGSMAKSYVGDHTIYPQIFQSSTATTSKSITIHLSAAGGDPYSYLTDICVPISFILPLVLPEMGRTSASAYSYPPVVQLNIPGLWGTRLGMVTQVDITKNPSGKDFSIHGYPLSVDVNITVTDLQHVMVATGIDKPAMFLNNNTMFDYIAQCAGVDKYRVNGSMRLITKLTLGMSALSVKGMFMNVGNAMHNDLHHLANKIKKTYAI